MSTIKKNLGGDRLGSGSKMNVELHNYSRSTHDLSSVWRSTMAPGTLVPFMKKLALPGDKWEINLDADVMTYPTVGPMFANFKLQLDVFLCPIRLYQGKLHNNALGIGMNMAQVKLPQIKIECNNLNIGNALEENGTPLEFQQIDQSSILAYLGIRGLGHSKENKETVVREFNALPYLSYWDIYKNYYANKQEEVGAVINTPPYIKSNIVEGIIYFKTDTNSSTFIDGYKGINLFDAEFPIMAPENYISSLILIDVNNTPYQDIIIKFTTTDGTKHEKPFLSVFSPNNVGSPNPQHQRFNVIGWTESVENMLYRISSLDGWFLKYDLFTEQNINVKIFPLSNLDDMRNDLLLDAKKSTPYIIDKKTYEPYGLPFKMNEENEISSKNPIEGLALKTYQSDIFNNWLSTEWLENDQGTGINQITAVSTQEGNFQIDALILAKKVYDMLNRIAVSGGSYDDWLEAVWAHDSYRRAESPIYMGGLSRDVIFQEVVSTSRSGDEPLGDLAGKGRLGERKKGGYIEIKVDEPSYIIGIASLTPRIDYSQGNEWDVNLQTMDDFHKPALDGIGFQELITDQMAFWDTKIEDERIFNSVGKQPAWINYMTDFNKSYGNFADSRKEMFMTLNRRYEFDTITNQIKDLTTYIDPAKFNYMFAYTDRSAQNFWVQIASDVTARRKMSAKIMPNL